MGVGRQAAHHDVGADGVGHEQRAGGDRAGEGSAGDGPKQRREGDDREELCPDPDGEGDAGAQRAGVCEPGAGEERGGDAHRVDMAADGGLQDGEGEEGVEGGELGRSSRLLGPSPERRDGHPIGGDHGEAQRPGLRRDGGRAREDELRCGGVDRGQMRVTDAGADLLESFAEGDGIEGGVQRCMAKGVDARPVHRAVPDVAPHVLGEQGWQREQEEAHADRRGEQRPQAAAIAGAAAPTGDDDQIGQRGQSVAHQQTVEAGRFIAGDQTEAERNQPDQQPGDDEDQVAAAASFRRSCHWKRLIRPV